MNTKKPGKILSLVVIIVVLCALLLSACRNDIGSTPTQGTEPTQDMTDIIPTKPADDSGDQSNETDPSEPSLPNDDEEDQGDAEDPDETVPVDAEPESTEPEHVHSYTQKIVKATCTDGGYTLNTCECGDSYQSNKTSKTDHSYSKKVVQPTCQKTGYTVYTCSCGDSYTGNKTSKTDHQYSATVTYPTCTSEGYTTYKCNWCDDKYIGNKTSETEHAYVPKLTPPTCTSEGYTTYTCSNCNDSYVSNKVSELDHSYSKSVVAPTCTSEGYTTYTCVCGDTYDADKTNKIPHSYVDTIVASTCTTKGYTEHICSVCSDKYTSDVTDLIPHTFINYATNNDATCIVDGTKTAKCDLCDTTDTIIDIGSALGHNFNQWASLDENSHAHNCTREGCTEIESAPHKHENPVVTAPTCVEEGFTTTTCECGNEKKSDFTATIDHAYKDVVTAPTCSAKGYTTHTCSMCDDSYIDTYTEMVEHTPGEAVEENRQEPTCENDGAYDSVIYCSVCSTELDRSKQIVDPLGHLYGDWTVTIAATCSSEGEERRDCERCDLHETRVTPSVPHHYNVIVTKPTCQEKGYSTYICSKCNDTFVGDETDIIDHIYEGTVTEPTCQDKGFTTYNCTMCSTSYVDDYVDVIDHIFDNYISDNNATCEMDGTKTSKCSMCDNVNTVDDEGSALGHEYGDWYIIDDATHAHNCIRNGCEFSESKNHNYQSIITAPTCTTQGYTVYTCDNCNHSYTSDYVEVIPHEFEAVVTEPTCTEKGYTTYTCACGETVVDDYTDQVPHKYSTQVVEATCTEEGYTIFTCECGYTYNGDTVSKKPHSYESTVTPPTCTSEGYTTHVCSVCGDSYVNNTVNKLDHVYTSTVIAPTCTAVGYTLHTCDCGHKYTSDETDKLDHAYTPTVIQPTCTEDGYTIYECNMCHDKYNDNIVPTSGHNWGVWVTIKEPTIVSEGTAKRTCTICGAEEEKVLDRLPIFHEHSYEAVVTEPTCFTSGYTTYTCECGDSYTDNFVSKLEHNYEATVTPPTCTTYGYSTYICSLCGDRYMADQTEKLEHSYVDTTVDATCTTGGYTTHTCSACGNSYTDSETNALGHAYGPWTVVKDSTAKTPGEKNRTCDRCCNVEVQAIDVIVLDSSIVAYYKVVNGVVMDLVTETVVDGATISNGYFTGGTIKLPQDYSNWTYQMIVDYNEASTAGVVKQMKFWSNSGKYEECDNVFKLNEVGLITSRGSVRVPWVADSWNSGYTVTVPIQLYAHISTNYEYLPMGDTFWSFSMDSVNGTLNSRINGATSTTTMKTYENDEGETKYVSKVLPKSFTLTTAHAIKEIVVYDRALTQDEQKSAYESTGIVAPTSGINQVVNGLTDMGSSLYFTKDNQGTVTMLESAIKKGTYTVKSDSGYSASYTIQDYVHPDLGIDNSIYESVHIVNELVTMDVGKQYSLVAYPYPFNVVGADGKSDQFDVTWSTSDSNVMAVIDGLLIAKKAGTVTVTATLTGTNMSDSVTIQVIQPEKVVDRPWHVPSNYVSANGESFSDTDYAMTTRAIYAAIDEAHANGYNHIIFPKQNFYAQPITNSDGTAKWYYVPSNMTIEFPEGSVFYMMDNDVSRGPGNLIEIHYFHFGVPNNDHENVCENSHLIVDTYYGERYNNTTHKETEYLEENRFVNFGRKSINCSVEVRNAYSVAGYFIVADGTSSTNKKTGVMNYGDFAMGRLNDSGEIEENANWISTTNFITVPDYGTDGYFISQHGQDSYAGKYWGGCRARTYDILWYDDSQTLIKIDRFQGRGDYYDIPDNATYFKVSLQQNFLPEPEEGKTMESPWIAMHSDGASKMCEIKNTKVFNSACGVFSVVGQTDGLWIHHCYTNRDGMKPYNERTGDFENGWTQMRHSIVSNNSFKGYFANHGYNTFIHTNYMTNYSGFSGEAELLRYINNTTDYVEISEKCQAHIFYNTLYTTRVDKFTTSIGHTYTANNSTGKWVRSY